MRSVAGFSETAAVVAEPDAVRFSADNQESRQGRGFAVQSSSFSETEPVVPEPDKEKSVTIESQEDRQGRVFRPVAAKPSSFSETIPVVPGANVQLFNGRQDIRQGKVLQPDTSMFSSTSEFFTETDTVVAQPDAERNRESRFHASEEIQENRGARVMGPDMTLFQPQSPSFLQTAAVIPEADEARNEKLSSAQTREKAERPVLFQPRPKAERQGRILHL